MSVETSPLRMAIVGLGFGRLIINALQEAELSKFFNVVALSDLDMDKAVGVAKAIGARAATLDEILQDTSIPVIGLFTGPSGRAELVRKAVRAGKHVMTTKPFERNAAAGREVLEEAARLGRVVHLNSPSPDLPPDLAVIRLWQKKFQLGRPVSAQARGWVRSAETADGGWQDDSSLCPSSPLFRLGIYLINDVVEFFGNAEEVQVMTSRLFTGRPTPDHAQLNIKFRDGSLVNIFASFCVQDGDPYRNTLVLNFENGTVYRNAGAEGKTGGDSHLKLVISGQNGFRDPVLAATVKLAGYSGEYPWEPFYHAVTKGQGPPPDYPEKVAAGLRLVDAMSLAERNGGSKKLSGPS